MEFPFRSEAKCYKISKESEVCCFRDSRDLSELRLSLVYRVHKSVPKNVFLRMEKGKEN